MDQPLPPPPLHDPRAPRLVERRRHPRVESADLVASSRTHLGDAELSPRARPLRGVLAALARLVRGRRCAGHGAGHGARLVAARRARLPGLADRLERILAELDALEAWREASDVCAAVERLRARSD